MYLEKIDNVRKVKKGMERKRQDARGIDWGGGAVTHDFEGQRRSSKWIVNH